LIVNNALLATNWSSQPVIEGALLAFEGKTIVDFGPVGKLIDRYDHPHVLEAAGRVVVPGLINAHTRLDRSFLVGAPPVAGSPRNALEARERIYRPLERALNAERLYWSASSALLDALRAGVTTVFAFAPLIGPSSERLEPIRRAAAEVGVRTVLIVGLSADSPGSALADAVEYIERARATPSERLTVTLGFEDTTAMDEPRVVEAVAAAHGAKSAPHVVLAEDAAEVDRCHSRWGMAPAARLERLGMWRHGGVAVRGATGLREEEDVLQRADVVQVQCPTASQFGTGESLDLMSFASARTPVAIGSNGLGQNLARELATVALQQRSLGRTQSDAINLAFRSIEHGGAELATRVCGRNIGRIKPGARADLVVTGYRPVTPMDERNLFDHFFWGIANASVDSVIVNGKLLYHNGAFVHLDEERIRHRAREAAEAAWEEL
jgi:cytosine/adenosine deaminase-related metal-dependent hydrolase